MLCGGSTSLKARVFAIDMLHGALPPRSHSHMAGLANWKRPVPLAGILLAGVACLVSGAQADSTPIWTMPVAVGAGPSRRCGATTAKGTTRWTAYGYDGIQLQVPTSTCNFTSPTQYATTIIGSIDEWGSTGTHTLLQASQTGFTVIVLHPTLRGTELLDAAQNYNWRVSWIGDSGANTGITLPGKSGWRQGKSKHVLMLDVNTEANNYKAAPTYFTSFHGFTNHWRVDGSPKSSMSSTMWSSTCTGTRSALPMRSHRAMSTPAIAVIATPRRP